MRQVEPDKMTKTERLHWSYGVDALNMIEHDLHSRLGLLGPGYQPRMNRVLRAFMHMRLAKLIDGPDTTDYILRPEEVMRDTEAKPRWGDTKRKLGAMGISDD